MATPLWFEIVFVSSSLSRVSEGNLTVQNGGIRIEISVLWSDAMKAEREEDGFS